MRMVENMFDLRANQPKLSHQLEGITSRKPRAVGTAVGSC